MKILTLIIKQKWFDAILSGEKTVETREVRPTNTKYISYRDNNTGKVYKKDLSRLHYYPNQRNVYPVKQIFICN